MKRISSGSLKLDRLISGFPTGSIIHIYGESSTGKTSLVLSCVKCLPPFSTTLLVDADYKFDLAYAEAMGVDPKSLIVARISKPEHISTLIQSEIKPTVVIIDSVAAIDIADSHTNRWQMAKLLSIISEHLLPSGCCIILVNQTRWSPRGGTTPTGSLPLRWYPSMIIRVDRLGMLPHQTDKFEGYLVKATIERNRHGLMGTTELELYYGEGINCRIELVELATEAGIIQKQGQWYRYNDLVLGNGKRTAADALYANHQLYKSILDSI